MRPLWLIPSSLAGVALFGFLAGVGFHIATAVLQDTGHASGTVNAAPDPDFDGVPSTREGPCGSDALDPSSGPERIDGVFAGVDDDGDAEIDEPLPIDSSTVDCDGDGFTGNSEQYVFAAANTVNDQKTCAVNAWPPDFNDDTFITGFDLQAVAAVIGKNVPPGPVRRDIAPDGAITGADLSAVAARIGKACG